MTYFMGRSTGPAQGLLITRVHIDSMREEPLNGSCQEVDGKYKCVVAYQGKVHTFNKHSTIAACNAQYDKELKKLHAISKPRKRKPAEKGYRVRLLADGVKTFDVYLAVRGETIFKGNKKTEEDARELYLASFVEEFGEIE